MPWQRQTRIIGRALGRATEAAEIVAGIEERFADARAAHPQFARKRVILAGGEASKPFGVFASQDPRSRFLDALGLKTHPRIDAITGKEYYAELSRERWRLLETDLLVFLGPTRANRAAMQADVLYQRLDVVRGGRTVYLDQESEPEAALNYNSPLSLPFALDELVPRISAALDGDPKTVVAGVS